MIQPGYGAALPPYSLEKIESTPDLIQTNPEAGLPDGGVAHCAPVSVSNSLMWLAGHGYERLAPKYPASVQAQGKLVQTISGPRYMGTTLEEGTSAVQIINGLTKYLGDHGYHAALLAYQGWDYPDFSTKIRVPQLNWIKAGIIGKSAVWLKIGWYKYIPREDRYRRFAGHWVTLVGYGKDQQGRVDPNVLIIHDPAPRGGLSFHHDYISIIPLLHGSVSNSSGKRSINAAGFYKLEGDLKIKEGADAGILDAAIVLKME